MSAGALGGGISGSGPSMFLLCSTAETADAAAAAIDRVYSATGIAYNVYTSGISTDGVRII
jgi:homoserine kinase